MSIVCILFIFTVSSHALPNNTKMVTDHFGHKVAVPKNPQRIASLHTMSTTGMLWELEASLVGTATRIKADEGSRPYIRSVEEVFGIKFQDTKLVNYGVKGADIERIKQSQPDLIVGNQKHMKVYDKLSVIAPTVLINYDSPNLKKVYQDLASWIGKEHLFVEKEKAYRIHLEKVKTKFSLSPTRQTIAVVRPEPGKATYRAYKYYNAFTTVAYDLGFKTLPFLDKQLSDNTQLKVRLSSETFAQINPDYLLATFSNHTGETKKTVYQGLDEIAPGWRKYSSAYKKKQVLVTIREKAHSFTFKAMHFLLDEFAKIAK